MDYTKEWLHSCLKKEKAFYIPEYSLKRRIQNRLLGVPNIERWKFIKAYRKS